MRKDNHTCLIAQGGFSSLGGRGKGPGRRGPGPGVSSLAIGRMGDAAERGVYVAI